MIVKYYKKREEFSDSGITLGNNYLVLKFIFHGNNNYYIILDESNEPIVYPVSLFEILDPSLPLDWIFSVNKDLSGEQYATFEPVNFKNDILADFHDSTPEREQECKIILEKEVQILKKFHELE